MELDDGGISYLEFLFPFWCFRGIVETMQGGYYRAGIFGGIIYGWGKCLVS